MATAFASCTRPCFNNDGRSLATPSPKHWQFGRGEREGREGGEGGEEDAYLSPFHVVIINIDIILVCRGLLFLRAAHCTIPMFRHGNLFRKLVDERKSCWCCCCVAKLNMIGPLWSKLPGYMMYVVVWCMLQGAVTVQCQLYTGVSLLSLFVNSN